MMPLLMFGVFIMMAVVMVVAKKYTDKRKTVLNFTQIVVIIFGLICLTFFILIKNIGEDECQKIVANVDFKTKVICVTFDIHKPYFKYMTLADGKYLPIPEEMNNVLKINDSICKSKGEKFYLIMNTKTKNFDKYEVKIHRRNFTKPY